MKRYLSPGVLIPFLVAAVVVALAIPLLGRPSASASAHPAVTPAPAGHPATARPARPARPRTVQRITKVLTIVEENHSLRQMKSGMPYLYSLARRYAYSKNYRAISHPSLPNYLAIVGGDTFGVRNDAPPSAHRLSSSTVFGQAHAHRLHAATYSENMRSRCALTGNATRGYAVKHNPWAYFVRERALCRASDVSTTGFRRAAARSALPQIGLLIPNKCHDAHDCGLGTADRWLRSQLSALLSSTDFRRGRLLVVITADEDDTHSGNRVLTVVLHSSLAGKHKVVSTPLNHYSLSRLLSETVGSRPLRHAARARSMAAAFGLRVGPR